MNGSDHMTHPQGVSIPHARRINSSCMAHDHDHDCLDMGVARDIALCRPDSNLRVRAKFGKLQVLNLDEAARL